MQSRKNGFDLLLFLLIRLFPIDIFKREESTEMVGFPGGLGEGVLAGTTSAFRRIVTQDEAMLGECSRRLRGVRGHDGLLETLPNKPMTLCRRRTFPLLPRPSPGPSFGSAGVGSCARRSSRLPSLRNVDHITCKGYAYSLGQRLLRRRVFAGERVLLLVPPAEEAVNPAHLAIVPAFSAPPFTPNVRQEGALLGSVAACCVARSVVTAWDVLGGGIRRRAARRYRGRRR